MSLLGAARFFERAGHLLVAVLQRGVLSLREPHVFVRVGLALLMLVRHDDLLRGIVALEHHAWGPGPEFGRQSLAPEVPGFAFPLLPGLGALLPYSDLLVRLRVGSACLLLVGFLPRINALVLATVSAALLFADGFRYLHHLLILYVCVLWLAFPAPRPAHVRTGTEMVSNTPRITSVKLLRAQVLVTYFFAGLAKCSSAWFSGSTLLALHAEGFVSGSWMDATLRLLGGAGMSVTVAAIELFLPLLLAFRKTRAVGVMLALLFHMGIHMTMRVSTFGMTLIVLLGAFLPTAAERARLISVRWGKRDGHAIALLLVSLLPLSARWFGTEIGSYAMFTRLVHYRLDIAVDGAVFPRARLARHLGRDGARIVRLANGEGIGEVNVEVLGRALPKLAHFVCDLSEGAREARLTLRSVRIEGGLPAMREVQAKCGVRRWKS